jgi:hypothetical protein
MGQYGVYPYTRLTPSRYTPMIGWTNASDLHLNGKLHSIVGLTPGDPCDNASGA